MELISSCMLQVWRQIGGNIRVYFAGIRNPSHPERVKPVELLQTRVIVQPQIFQGTFDNGLDSRSSTYSKVIQLHHRLHHIH
jgi:hypothetical protein